MTSNEFMGKFFDMLFQWMFKQGGQVVILLGVCAAMWVLNHEQAEKADKMYMGLNAYVQTIAEDLKTCEKERYLQGIKLSEQGAKIETLEGQINTLLGRRKN